jgi:hypothetical protein
MIFGQQRRKLLVTTTQPSIEYFETDKRYFGTVAARVLRGNNGRLSIDGKSGIHRRIKRITSADVSGVECKKSHAPTSAWKR